MELTEVKGLGPSKLKLLNKLGIYNIDDLVTFFPFRYEEIQKSDIASLKQDDHIVIDGVIITPPKVFFFSRSMNKLSFSIETEAGMLQVSLFNRAFLKTHLEIGTEVTVSGKYDLKHRSVTASDLYFGLLDQDRIEPVYHTTYGITNKNIRSYIESALKDYSSTEILPNTLLEKYHLLDRTSSVKALHHPEDQLLLKKALARMKYEELFYFMLKMNLLKANYKKQDGLKKVIYFKEVEKFINSLPFTLTEDQQKSVNTIYDDLVEPKRMNRLLQGDVGSGKTIVALISIYMNYLSGYQSALLAPTEILSIQHYNSAVKLLEPFGVKIGLLTGKLKAKEKKEIYKKLVTGELDLVVGTHALFTDDVVYSNLGLVITDEQHRFGVNQRESLKNKGVTPDILYMSATPIPRTYALMLYGDMDISSIKTVPHGRKEVITLLKKDSEMKDVLALMFEQLKLNHQIYVIAPLIEESEKADFENVYDLEQKMNRAFGKLFKIGILHGKLTNEEKDAVMSSFKNNEIQILISTTVIEVGVDVANATMMVIFDSFRFGLSSLHQLRGRVGRNSLQSYCILISNKETERLEILTKTTDGFKVSEEDFMIRGSGDLFGEKQSGDMVFQVADLKKDFNILLKAKEDSQALLDGELDITEEEKNFVLGFLDKTGNLA